MSGTQNCLISAFTAIFGWVSNQPAPILMPFAFSIGLAHLVDSSVTFVVLVGGQLFGCFRSVANTDYGLGQHGSTT